MFLSDQQPKIPICRFTDVTVPCEVWVNNWLNSFFSNQIIMSLLQQIVYLQNWSEHDKHSVSERSSLQSSWAQACAGSE